MHARLAAFIRSFQEVVKVHGLLAVEGVSYVGGGLIDQYSSSIDLKRTAQIYHEQKLQKKNRTS